ncbi:hypothetical protein WM24_21140 [Burkholderia ubonensis]|nr:hypothetical protein WK08_28825 [Burkholderia ubonensis]KWN82077.1 hypothetical protein WM24_21140 [Burkholderia ubonensis]
MRNTKIFRVQRIDQEKPLSCGSGSAHGFGVIGTAFPFVSVRPPGQIHSFVGRICQDADTLAANALTSDKADLLVAQGHRSAVRW